MSRARPATAIAGSAAVALLAAGDPLSPPNGPDGAVVSAAAFLAWALVGWTALGLAVVATERLPGAIGRFARGAGRIVLPRVLRRLAETVLGVAVVTAPLAAPAAAAHRPWPDLDRATTPRTTTAAIVRVAPGDCLWRIAARDLRRSGAPPDDEAVAESWPRWYAANREVIGADPDLIRPGQVLTHPDRRSR